MKIRKFDLVIAAFNCVMIAFIIWVVTQMEGAPEPDPVPVEISIPVEGTRVVILWQGDSATTIYAAEIGPEQQLEYTDWREIVFDDSAYYNSLYEIVDSAKTAQDRGENARHKTYMSAVDLIIKHSQF